MFSYDILWDIKDIYRVHGNFVYTTGFKKPAKKIRIRRALNIKIPKLRFEFVENLQLLKCPFLFH